MPSATERLTVDDVRQYPTLTVQQTASLLDSSDDLIYAAVKRGEIQSLSLGRKVLIPTAPLLALLGQEAA